jgi:hypothetical protein
MQNVVRIDFHFIEMLARRLPEQAFGHFQFFKNEYCVSPERPSLIAMANGDFRFLFVGTQFW